MSPKNILNTQNVQRDFMCYPTSTQLFFWFLLNSLFVTLFISSYRSCQLFNCAIVEGTGVWWYPPNSRCYKWHFSYKCKYSKSSLASPLPQVPLVPTDEVVVQSRMWPKCQGIFSIPLFFPLSVFLVIRKTLCTDSA